MLLHAMCIYRWEKGTTQEVKSTYFILAASSQLFRGVDHQIPWGNCSLVVLIDDGLKRLARKVVDVLGVT